MPACNEGATAHEEILTFAPHGRTFQRLFITGDGYRLVVPHVASFDITDGAGRAHVRPDPGADLGLVDVLTRGTLAATMLALSGEIVLHASSVIVDNEAVVAVAGPSGRGKSTLTALLATQDSPVFAEDVLRIELTTPADLPTAHRGSTGIRLRAAPATSILEWATPSRAARTADGRTQVWFERSDIAVAPLKAIILPSIERGTDRPSAVRLSSAEAHIGLAACMRVTGWLTADDRRREFAQVASIAGAVPVYRLVTPWGPPFLPELAEEVHDIVRALA